MSKADEEKEKLGFIYTVLSDKEHNNQDTYTVLSNKLSFLFAIYGAILGYYLTTIQIKTNLFDYLHTTSGILHCITLFLLFIAIGLLLFASRTRVFINAPSEDMIVSNRSLVMSHINLLKQTIADMKAGYKENVKIINNVGSLINWSLFLIFLSVCGIIITICVH